MRSVLDGQIGNAFYLAFVLYVLYGQCARNLALRPWEWGKREYQDIGLICYM